MGVSGRQNKDHQESGHGFWISISDLMAGLIFIFLIILVVFSIQYKEEQNAFIEAKRELQSPAKTRSQILNDLKAILKADGLEVETLPEEGILRITEKTLTFPPARAVPIKDTLENLGSIAKALTMVLPCHSSEKESGKDSENVMANQNSKDVALNEAAEKQELPLWCQTRLSSNEYQCKKNFKGTIETVMIEGHTDSTTVNPGAGYLDNLSLSAARATTILRLLKKCDSRLGALYNKKQQPLIGASGYSFLRPIITNDTRDPRNRRIDIRLMMDLPDNALEPDKNIISRIKNKNQRVMQ